MHPLNRQVNVPKISSLLPSKSLKLKPYPKLQRNRRRNSFTTLSFTAQGRSSGVYPKLTLCWRSALHQKLSIWQTVFPRNSPWPNLHFGHVTRFHRIFCSATAVETRMITNFTARFMQLSTPNFWAAVTTAGSQHRVTRGSCVEEDQSRFPGSQPRLSQSVDGVHGAAARAARMRSAWMSGWGWELFWTLNSVVFEGCMKQAVTEI